MASQPYDPETDWRYCIEARYVPLESITNVDMSGITVGVATVVVFLCLRIQIAWSRAPIDGAVISSFIQSYSILLSTLLSINRPYLSLFDANNALIITSSPLTMRLVFTSISYLFGIESNFFKRIQSHRTIICTLGVLFLPLWLGVNLTISLSSWGFIDSELCSHYAWTDQLLMGTVLFTPLLLFFLFLLFILSFSLLSLILPGLPAFLLPGLHSLLPFTLIYLHFPTIYHALFPHDLMYNQVVGTLVSFFGVVFVLLIANPPWVTCPRDRASSIGRVFTALDFFWAAKVIANAIIASGSEYVASYGQLVALSAAVYPLMSTFKLGYDRRWDLFDFFRYLLNPVQTWWAVLYR